MTAVIPLTAISIHAPRAGSDSSLLYHSRNRGISIHAPRAGSDIPCPSGNKTADRFQSTLPVRGATPMILIIRHTMIYFNPRSPCGERPFTSSETARQSLFQSTLPVRGATKKRSTKNWKNIFQSTLPVRGATGGRLNVYRIPTISIHAPRAGSNYGYTKLHAPLTYFNPRSPCGERLLPCVDLV